MAPHTYSGASEPRRTSSSVRSPAASVARAPKLSATNPDAIVAQVSGRLEDLLREAFPEAGEVAVVDRTGGGDHFQVTVASEQFAGLTLVEQHRLVYDALAAPLADGTIHELRIKTRGGQ